LFHVLPMMAIEVQKLILYTSDVVHAKVTITGEPTTPSLLITALPRIDDLIAGYSRAHDLLRAQPATSQCILHESVALDDPPFRAQLVALQCTLHNLVDLDKLNSGNDEVCMLGIRHMVPYPNIAMYYAFCIMPMTSCLTLVTRSLLAHQYDPFFKVYMGDYAELFPERIINCDCKQTCILPVTQDITKCNAPGESFTMDLKTSARVSLISPFGRHMPTGPTGL